MATTQDGRKTTPQFAGINQSPYTNINAGSTNAVSGVITVGSTASKPDGQYVTIPQQQFPHHQQHHYHHTAPQQQQPVQSNHTVKPTILNHFLSSGPSQAESTINHSIEMSNESVPMTTPSLVKKMWLLIEWEAIPGEPISYSVIDSSDLILDSNGTNTRETIHTGKVIYVRRGKKLQQATVVIISDDKQFIDAEVRQLRQMSANNHFRNQRATAVVQSVEQKRRRVEVPDRKSDEQPEPASPEFEPMPVQSQISTANWVANCKTERILSPSPSVASVALSTQHQSHLQQQQQFRSPPMTFDQQTQTDPRCLPQQSPQTSTDGNRSEILRILALQETILSEQKSMRMENEYNRKMMFDIAEQLNSFSDTLKHIASKVDAMQKYEISEVKSPVPNVASYVVLGTGGEESRDRPPSSVAGSYSNKVANLMIEPICMHEDSNASLNQSKFSIVDENSSAASTPKNLNFSNRLSASALSLSNTSVHSQPAANDNNADINEVLKDWNDEDDDPNDDSTLTPIGPNNTMVKKKILNAINWTNYKVATRKLLMTLFTREILASHTLTGRPSPAFMGDRAKPVKDRLDQKIITDIIAIVTKICKVSEPMVRTAITTKCADENKMNRMKSIKGSSSPAVASNQTIISQYVQHATTTVAEPSSQHPEMTTVVPVGVRRIKRENKENVH
ncbi:myotubularin-related protein DDB_G0290005-like [Uranotaenia lowii]|uniref:myotubularin-related protein DDB_G0290005-like n=1 Tax=Uranotaenia lowii TaxID=190385 RepID=UPI0024789333|nr:myotubularin-related protein DDB_G0290005-like [Uranotaenia lowii]XP_055593857.1 myotubularin-related protein DDB_G0290005-like [Uranotaenia lowii]